MLPDPLIVALFGGPGTGKSTTAALAFGRLKEAGFNVELVPEYAKDLTWEGRHYALSHQPYVAGKQLRNYDRLYGKVDAIITDTSSLYSLIYMHPDTPPTVSAAFSQYLLADWRARRTLNVLLRRNYDRQYNPAGRSQTEKEAMELDGRIEYMLEAARLPVMDVTREDAVTEIVTEVVRVIG